MRDEEYHAIREAAEAEFGKIPGVHSVGIGACYKDGRVTGEIAIQIFVDKKKREGDLAPEHILPKSYRGVRVDVIERGRPVDAADKDTSKYRPMEGGIQISPGSGSGTLGCFVRAISDGTSMLLTNQHVLDCAVGDRVYQPSKACCACCDCCPSIVGHLVKSQKDAKVDAAVASMIVDFSNKIVDIGTPVGTHTITPAEAATKTYEVQKRGRTTLLTYGFVDSIGDKIIIIPDTAQGTAKFVDFGDSGSALLNTNLEVVGLVYAKDSADQGLGFANMIDNVLSAMEVEIDISPPSVSAREARQDAALTRWSGVSEATQQQILRTARGRMYVSYYERHHEEIMRLVNENRRVATVWRRNLGPAMFRRGLDIARDPAGRTHAPVSIDGYNVEACANRILDIFHTHGSEALRADIEAVRGDLEVIPGRTLEQIADELERMGPIADRR